MLYEIAHIIRDKLGFLWELIELFNGCLFGIRYRNKLKGLNDVLAPLNNKFCIRQTTNEDVLPLVKFFSEQPKAAFEFFKPHGFDENSIRKIVRNKAFQTFVVLDGENVLGYFFLRSFFTGNCFRGRIVDYRCRDKGIGKFMAKAIGKISLYEGLRMFASISPNNISSLKSVEAVSEVKILKTLKNGYYYIEVIPEKE